MSRWVAQVALLHLLLVRGRACIRVIHVHFRYSIGRQLASREPVWTKAAYIELRRSGKGARGGQELSVRVVLPTNPAG